MIAVDDGIKTEGQISKFTRINLGISYLLFEDDLTTEQRYACSNKDS